MAFKNLLIFSLADHLKIGEVAGGTSDGVNAVFTTASTVQGGSLDVYVGSAGGFALMAGNGVDYTLSLPHTITFNVAPTSGSIILVDYIH